MGSSPWKPGKHSPPPCCLSSIKTFIGVLTQLLKLLSSSDRSSFCYNPPNFLLFASVPMSQSHKSVTKSSLSITLKRPTQLNTNHATKPKSPNISESTHISKRPNSLHLWDGCIKYSLLHITPYPPPTHKRNHDDKRPYFFLHSFILKILLHQGRTDISSVLVGNVLDAPHRRDRFLIGFMLVSILLITISKLFTILII